MIFINPSMWANGGMNNWYAYLHELVHNVTGKGDGNLPGGSPHSSDELMNHHCDM